MIQTVSQCVANRGDYDAREEPRQGSWSEHQIDGSKAPDSQLKVD
jgi:hypothetical protein